MTYHQYLKEKTHLAIKLKKESEAIKILVLELSGYNGASFLANINEEIPNEKIQIIDNAINEYLVNNKPVQYILGYSYFYGYKMIVNQNVLIPRRETEELVGYVLASYDEVFPDQEVKVVDIGTGSGNIAIALSKEEAKMTLYASDVSQEAINVAKENTLNNDAKVEFLMGDTLEPFIKEKMRFSILVSNPPYIPNDEYVEDIVNRNEPHLALFGGADGMHFYEAILKDASKILEPKSIIAFEHSYNKGKEMMALAQKYFPNGICTVIKDMQGKDRFIIIKNIK